MKKIALSLVTIGALAATNGFAADTLEGAFKEGKVSGQIRSFYISRSTDTTGAAAIDRDGLALGGKVGYETGSLYGISAGAVFYTTNKLDDESSTAAENDLTLFKRGSTGFPEGTTYLGQAYLQGKYGKTTVKVGRQQLDTPLAGSDDARMLPNLFTAALAINSDLPNTTLIGAHVTEIAYGTFANGYSGGTAAGAALSLISGYGARSDYKTGEFQSMSKAALGDGVKNNGVSVLAVVNKSVPNLTVQLWDYYAHNILNAIYAQADYGWKCLLNPAVSMTGSLQYIKESEIGDKLAGNIDANYYAAQLAAKYGSFNAAVAYSSNSDKGGVITPWGGMPAFTQGMVTRHQFFADTTAYKISAGYNLKEIMGQDITASAYYASFDVGTVNTYYTAKGTATEPGFDIIYNNAGIKNLQLRLRGNFPEDFKKTATASTGWSEYRLIANYNF